MDTGNSGFRFRFQYLFSCSDGLYVVNNNDNNDNNNNNYGNRVMDRFIESRWTINNATVDTRKCFTINSTPDAYPSFRMFSICTVIPSGIFFFGFLRAPIPCPPVRWAALLLLYCIRGSGTTRATVVEMQKTTA